MSTFAEYSQKLVSEKVTLVTCEAAQSAKVFTLYSGTTYQKSVSYFVSNVKNFGYNLIPGADKDSLGDGEFYYDVETKILYVNMPDGLSGQNLAIIYKHFFSTAPLRLPYDLNTDRKSTRLNSSHRCISYSVFCLKKKRAILGIVKCTHGTKLNVCGP